MTTQHPLNDNYCVFQAENAVWAVAAAAVREIADAAPIVAVPEAPSEVVGVCHVRMEFLPVLSLPGLLGEAGADHHAPEFLLILNGGEGPWALPIQKALSLQALEVAVGEMGSDFRFCSMGLLGTASFRDKVLRVIDASWLYRRAHEVIENHWRRGVPSDAARGPALSAAVPG